MKRCDFGTGMPGWTLTCAALALLPGAASAARIQLVKLPKQAWVKAEPAEAAQPDALRYKNRNRAAIIRLSLADRPPGDEDVAAIVEGLTQQSRYTVARMFDRQILRDGDVQNGFSMMLPDGRKASYFLFWHKRKDQKYAVTSYLTADHSSQATSVEEFKLAIRLNNQLRRGAVLYAPSAAARPPEMIAQPVIDLFPPEQGVAQAPVQSAMQQGTQTASPPALQASVAAAPLPAPPPAAVPLPAPVKIATAPTTPAAPLGTGTPAIAAAVPIAPQTPFVPPAAVAAPSPVPVSTMAPGAAIAAPSANPAYRYRAAPGLGVRAAQVATIVYAPLEFSEVYVLFKDGSFHENLPVALEEWDVGAAKKGDPESWGKWKRAKDAGEFELRYADGETVTIAGSPIAPASPAVHLDGTYDVETDTPQPSSASKLRRAIIFSGDHFALPNSDNAAGRYTIDGYTITLTFADGHAERRPFFIIPPEDPGDTPSIWFGDELRVKI
jgi:hypothetical protein